MTRTTKKLPPLRIPCLLLNRVLSVRRITKASLVKLIGKLKHLVETSSDNEHFITKYATAIVTNLLTPSELAIFKETVKSVDSKIANGVVAAIYNSIVEHYPALRIEYICSEVNGIVSPEVTEEMTKMAHDPDFDKMLEKETSPKKKLRAKFEFNSMEDVDDLRSYLQSNIKGQDQAIETVCNAMKLKAVGFARTVSLFFIGPTGVGKTQLSTLLGEKYSGNFFRINCGEFANGHEVNKLTGAPPGYIGSGDKALLKEKADKSNKWVFLFDEIEKAHEKFFNFLLALMDFGKVSDNAGNVLDFSNSIFVFTSNCGVRDLKTKTTNFSKLASSQESTKEDLLTSIQHQFSPEFRNRIDEFVFFNAITPEIASQIVELSLKNLPLKKSDELIQFCVKNGFSEEFGARELSRFIKRKIAIPLADAILTYKIPGDKSASYDVAVKGDTIEVVNVITRQISQ